MPSKKTQFILVAFAIFWLIFIGWGMFKTGFKLFKAKTPAGPPVIAPVSEKEGEEEAVPLEKAASQETLPAPPTSEPGLILVRAVKVKPTDFRDSLPVMGTVKGKTETELKFENNGVIKSINFHEGDKINKGDLIATLDPKDALIKLNYAKNKFNAAQAAYNSVQKKLEVHQKLFNAGAIIQSKLEEVKLECESAKFQIETVRSEIELAESELNKTSLYANKNGVMGSRDKEEGEFVTPQDKIGTLLETDEVFVEIGVVERDIDKIKLGQKANVFVDTYPNTTFVGTVDSIFPVVEGKSRTLTAKIKVSNPQGLLLPGMFSRAEINIIELKDALIIPATALTNTKGITMAPVIPNRLIETTEDETQAGIVQLQIVKVGYITSDYAQITDGLSVGDLVVIEAQGELKDNAKVKIIGVDELSF